MVPDNTVAIKVKKHTYNKQHPRGVAKEQNGDHAVAHQIANLLRSRIIYNCSDSFTAIWCRSGVDLVPSSPDLHQIYTRSP